MAESTGGERRSTRVSRQLARARERNNRQLAQLRDRELRVDRGLRDYVAATAQITAANRVCDDKVAQLEARTRQVRAEHDERTSAVRAAQARAALAIHGAGRTVTQVAELLELSEKTARQLIGRGRALPPADYREPIVEYEARQ